MRNLSKITIAVLCALGITAVTAQTVQRDGKEVKPAQTRAPVQTAQAGGAAAGGAAGGATASVGAATAGTVAFISVGVAAVAAAASDANSQTVTHNP